MTKVVILAGGKGTRFREETENMPKPMVPISGRPLLWHLMKYYAAFGFNEFVICAGYKQERIKEYFRNYAANHADTTYDLATGEITAHKKATEDWKVSVIDTGPETLTASRLKAVRPYLNEERFFLTYGDGLSDVDIPSLVKCHAEKGKAVTLSAVHSPLRFGELEIEDGTITHFMEKLARTETRINGGFMVMEPEIFNYLGDKDEMLEFGPLQKLSRDGKLGAYKHDGFWQCMDNMREHGVLQDLWDANKAPWKIW